MSLEPREITCRHCGSQLTIEKDEDYCTKCGRRVFYDPKKQRRHQFMNYYIYVLILASVGCAIYLFNRMLEAWS